MSNRAFSANVQYNGEWIRNDDTWEYEPGASSYIDVPPNTTYAQLLDRLYDELEVDRCSYDLVVKVMYKSATKRNIPSVIKKNNDVKLFVEENRISKQESIGYIPLCISTVQKASANLSVVQKTFDPVISQGQDLNVFQKERDKPLYVHQYETPGETGAYKLTWKTESMPLDGEKERAQDLNCKNLRLNWGPSQQPLSQNPFKAWTSSSPFTSFNPQQHQNQPHINNPWRPKPGAFFNEGAKVRPQINQGRVSVAETGTSSGARKNLMMDNLNDKRKKRIDTSGSSKKEAEKTNPMEEGDLQNGGSLKESKKINESSSAIENGAQETETPGAQPTMKRMKSSPVKRIDTSGSPEKEADKTNPAEGGDLRNGGSLKESRKINEGSSAMENGVQETETPGAQPTMKRMKSSPVKRIDTSGSPEKEADRTNPAEEGDLRNGGSLKESRKINEGSSAMENGAQETETPGAQPTMKRMKSSPVKRIDTSGSPEKEADKTNPAEEGDLRNGGSLKESRKINEGSSAMENGAQETETPGAQPTMKRMKSSPVNAPEIPMQMELDSVELAKQSFRDCLIQLVQIISSSQ